MQLDDSVSKEAQADPMDRSAAKRAGAIWRLTSQLSGAKRQTVRDPSPVSFVRALATAGPRECFCAGAGVKYFGWG